MRSEFRFERGWVIKAYDYGLRQNQLTASDFDFSFLIACFWLFL